MILSSHGIVASQIASFDADAVAEAEAWGGGDGDGDGDEATEDDEDEVRAKWAEGPENSLAAVHTTVGIKCANRHTCGTGGS